MLLVVFEAEVSCPKEETHVKAMDEGVWLIIVHSPIFILEAEIAGSEIIVANLECLYAKAEDSLEYHGYVKQLAVGGVLGDLLHAHDEEPDIVSNVPRLLDAIVFLGPWKNIIEHYYMPEPGLSASVVHLKLVKHRATTA